jgi:mannosyltransferase
MSSAGNGPTDPGLEFAPVEGAVRDPDDVDVLTQPEAEPGAPDPSATVDHPTTRGAVRSDRFLWLIVAGAALLRFWRIGHQKIWYDELVTTSVVQVRLTDVFRMVHWYEGSPPLYFYLEWGWIRVFGRGDAALRSSSALMGTLTVVVVYALLIELRQTRRVARIGAALVAVQPMLIWYSQEARAYAMFALLASLTVLCLVRALHRERPIDYLLWSLAAAAAFGTHYFAAFLLAPQALWLLRTFWPGRRWRDAAFAFVPVALVGLPLLWLASDQQGEKQDWINDFPLTHRLTEGGRQFMLGPGEPAELLWVLALVPIAYASYVLFRSPDRAEKTIALAMVGIMVTAMVLSLVATPDYYLGRNVIGGLVLLAVPIALGLGSTRARAGTVAAVALCGVWLVASVWVTADDDLHKPDWEAVAHFLDREMADDSVVVFASNGYLALPLRRYGLADAEFVGRKQTIRVQELNVVFFVAEPAEPSRCGRWAGRLCEIFLFPQFPDELKGQFGLSELLRVNGFQINRYRSKEPVRLQTDQLVANPRDALVLQYDR